MLVEIGDKIVSTQIFERKFVCDLNACKGACCVEGDAGAPLTLEEIDILEEDLEAMLAEILIGEQTDEPTELSIRQAAQNKIVNRRPTVGAVATKLDKARDEIENRADGGVHAGFEPVSLSTPDDRAPSGRITTRFDRQR